MHTQIKTLAFFKRLVFLFVLFWKHKLALPLYVTLIRSKIIYCAYLTLKFIQELILEKNYFYTIL